MHNTTQRVMETRLQEQASEYGEVLDAKDSQIGDLTGLVESESDHAKLEQYATELRTRRDELRSRVATSREKRDSKTEARAEATARQSKDRGCEGPPARSCR